jgi:predicted metal-dependent hydrolase
METDPRLQHGVAMFNAGEFFAAHEIWEDLWVETVGAEKQLLQGLVQIAAGYAKVESGVRGGALKLLERGVAQLREFGPRAMGLALGPFVDGVEADLARLRAAAEQSVSIDLVCVPGLRLI